VVEEAEGGGRDNRAAARMSGGASGISKPTRCNGWAFFATQASRREANPAEDWP
jgi:hypothetical protein